MNILYTTLWYNPNKQYKNKIIHKDNDTLIIKYSGQKQGGQDKYIQKECLFFVKNNQRYSYYGKVIQCVKLPKENDINYFKLVIELDIKKGKSTKLQTLKFLNFSTKAKNGNEIGNNSGIINHY